MRGQAYGVEDGAQVAPVAVHGAFDGGFQLFDFFAVLRFVISEWRSSAGYFAVSLGWVGRIPCGGVAAIGCAGVLRLARSARSLRMTVFVGSC